MASSPPDPAARHSLPGGLDAVLPRLIASLIWFYCGALFLLFLAMELVGERWWPLAVALYLPQEIFLLPLIVLVPAALLAEVPARSYAILACAPILYLWHDPFYPGIAHRTDGPKLKLITNNFDQSHGSSLAPFVAAENPDFVALQDVGGQAPIFKRTFPGWTIQAAGQFILMSKSPIIRVRPLFWPLWRGRIVAFDFDVAWQGRELALYVVHLPSPRDDFAKLAGAGLLREMAGHNRNPVDNLSFGESMTARVELVRDFSAMLARERRPFVALGDFNMPADGYLHRIMTSRLTDCFARAGQGFGFTFPWDTRNPLTLGQGWLRIDYALAGPGWRVDECRVEPSRRSEHRAVAVELGWAP